MAENPTTAAGRKDQAEGRTDVMDRNQGYATPAKLFVMTAAAIFLGEVIVMFVLAAIPPISKGTEAFVDGMMITALITQVLYCGHAVPIASRRAPVILILGAHAVPEPPGPRKALSSYFESCPRRAPGGKSALCTLT